MSYVNLPVLSRGKINVSDKYLFPEEVFAARVQKVRDLMKDKGLDGVLVYSDALSKCYTNYLANSYSPGLWGGSMLIIPREGNIMNATSSGTREYEATRKRLPTFCDLMCCGMSMISSHHIVFDVLKFIDEQKYGTKWGGINLNRMYKLGFDPIVEKYPDLLDLTDEFDVIKAIKDDGEMFAMSQASSISEKAVNEFLRIADVDVVENVLSNEIERNCKEYGVSNISFLVSAGSEDVQLRQPRPRKFEKGDIVTAVVNAQFLRYNGVYAATRVIGGASAAQEELFAAAKKMFKEQLDELNKTRKACIGQKDSFCDKSQISSYTIINGIGVDMVEAPDKDGAEIDLLPGMTVNINFYAEKKGVGGILIGQTFYVAETTLVKINGQGA